MTVPQPRAVRWILARRNQGILGWRPTDALSRGLRWLYVPIYNKYFVDEIYNTVIVTPVVEGSRTILWKGMDAGVIDGTVNGVGARAKNIGGVLRLLQSGNIRSYATWIVFGSIVLIIAVGVMGVTR